MRLRQLGNGVTVILLLMSIMLSAFILKQWQNYTTEPSPIPGLSEKPREASKFAPKLFLNSQNKNVQMTQFSEILARPLFTEGRLPVEEPEPELAQPQQVGLPKLKLEGVVISPESRVAVIRDLTDNSLLRLSEGMIHAGWRITRVDTTEAVFERGDESHSFPLELINKPVSKSSTSKFRLPSKKKKKTPRRPRANTP